MTEKELEALRFPVGRFTPESSVGPRGRTVLVDEIAGLPERLRHAVEDLSDAQLDTPYRPGGWTVRQLVHHVPDSHLNSYVRFKWALTEERPTIRTYDQEAWAELADARTAPVEPSLALLESLHDRWTRWLRTLSDDDWSRTFVHPELGELDLTTMLQLYAWHGRHHLAHVTSLIEREGWSTA